MWIYYLENKDRMSQDDREKIEGILQQGAIDDPRHSVIPKP